MKAREKARKGFQCCLSRVMRYASHRDCSAPELAPFPMLTAAWQSFGSISHQDFTADYCMAIGWLHSPFLLLNHVLQAVLPRCSSMMSTPGVFGPASSILIWRLCGKVTLPLSINNGSKTGGAVKCLVTPCFTLFPRGFFLSSQIVV